MKKNLEQVSDEFAKKQVEQIVKMWCFSHCQELTNFILSIEQEKKSFDGIRNSTGISKDKNMRWALSLAIGLVRAIENKFPNVFTTKNEVRWFMREFPQFRISRKI